MRNYYIDDAINTMVDKGREGCAVGAIDEAGSMVRYGGVETNEPAREAGKGTLSAKAREGRRYSRRRRRGGINRWSAQYSGVENGSQDVGEDTG